MITIREHIVKNIAVISNTMPFIAIKECVDSEGKIHFMKQRVDENTYTEADPSEYGLSHYAEKKTNV